jgi:hypothetical protein
MATQLQLRKGNTAQTAVFTGALAEVTVDTDQDTVVVHDGTTVGGNYIVTKTQLQSNVSILQGINTTQNTNITAVNGFAAGAFNTANGANGLASGAYNTANGANGLASSAFNTANGANGLASSAFNTANGANGLAAGAYNTANGANGLAQGAYNEANTATTTAQGANGLAQGAFNQANTAATTVTQVNGYAQSAYATANSASANTIITQGVDTWQNTQITGVNQFTQSAFNTANGANGLAQGAYNEANTKFSSSGGNINGDVIITANNDLTVTGNLYVLGNTTSFGTQTLEVVDPMILLATGNYATDLLDIGFAGSYNDGANAHTGLFRESTVKEWYFFEGYTPEVSGNNNINIADASFRKANVNANYVKGNLIATTVTIGGRDQASVDSTQNTNITAVNNFAQSAYNTANGANGLAQSAYDKANTISLNQLINGTREVTLYANGIISLPEQSAFYNNTAALVANTAAQVLDSFNATVYRTAKYIIQGLNGTDVHSTEVILTHNDTDIYISEYGTIGSNTSLYTVSGSLAAGVINLTVSPASTNTTFDFVRTSLIARSLGLNLEGDLMSQSGSEDLNVGDGSEDLNV